MNSNNDNQQTENPVMDKLEDDLARLTNEARSTIQENQQNTSISNNEPQPLVAQTQPASGINPVDTNVQQSSQTAPANFVPNPTPVPENIPIEDNKKGGNLMSIAIILLIVAIVVAVAYVVVSNVYPKNKNSVSIPVATVTPVSIPTSTPIIEEQNTGSQSGYFATPFTSPETTVSSATQSSVIPQ
ncbi:MAG: hypothetical protein GYA62_08585 [Bacteroidales bacterium]|nr:hypothetical protein [Bacteroidales bacterium]